MTINEPEPENVHKAKIPYGISPILYGKNAGIMVDLEGKPIKLEQKNKLKIWKF